MLPIRRVLLNNVATSVRTLSSKASGLIDVTVDSEGIATARMQKAPVNSLNSEMLQALHDTIEQLNNSKCKGMILTSALPSVWCAGLDLRELHNPEMDRLGYLIDSILNIVETFLDAEVIITAAINGYTGAGGCIFPMLSQHRVMCRGGPVIGFNDTAVGIAPGKWATNLFVDNIGSRRAEYIMTSSIMLKADEAIKVGLIDEVAADMDDAIMKCKNYIKLFDKIPQGARISTKRLIREPYLTDFRKNRLQYKQEVLQSIINENTQKQLEHYIKMLQQKKNKQN